MMRNSSLPETGGDPAERPAPEPMFVVRVTTRQLDHLSHEAIIFLKHDRRNRRIYSADVGRYTSAIEAREKATSYQEKGMVVEIIWTTCSTGGSQTDKVLSRKARSHGAVVLGNSGRA